MQTLIGPVAWGYQSRRVGFEQSDDGIGYNFVRAALEKACTKRARRHAATFDQSPREISRVGVRALSPLLVVRLIRERVPSCASLGSLEGYFCASLAQFTVMVEPVESELSILADLNEVAVGIAHVAAPFPAVIV
jgi:hypothetical protein